MLLLGEYQTGRDSYLFIRQEVAKSITWLLFRKTALISNTEVELLKRDFSLKKNSDFYMNFLVGGLHVTITETKIFGNVNVVNNLAQSYTRALSKSYKNTSTEETESQIATSKSNSEIDYINFLEYKDTSEAIAKLNARQIAKIDYRYKQEFINAEISSTETVLASIYRSVFKAVNWEDYDIFSVSDRENTDTILATKAKTLQQLRLTHDLSWYFDINGESKKEYKVIDTIEKLKTVLTMEVSNVDLWSVDVETTGLKCYGGKNRKHFDNIVSLMMSWRKDQAIFLPIDMAYMKNISKDWVDVLKPYLESINAVGHNISFDARALYTEFNIDLNIAYDTQQLNFNINCHDAKFHNSLKYLEHRYFGVDTLELSDIFGTKKLAGLFRYLPQQLALIYACPDVDMNLQLFYLLWDKLPVSCRKTFKLDMDTMKNITKMDCVGNRVDLAFATEYRKANNRDMELLKELIFKVVGQSMLSNDFINKMAKSADTNNLNNDEIETKVKEFFDSSEYKNAKFEFNLDSNKVLGNVLFNILKYPVQSISKKTGEPAVNASTFKALLRETLDDNTDGYLKKDIPSAVADIPQLAGETVPPLISAKEYNKLKYPLAHLIVEYRLRYKRNSTFFKQLLDESIDSFYYTSSKMANAETFRIINVVQTLQGFMKQMIVPYSDDHYMLVFDFSQIEYRYMAGMADVKDLVQNLNSPRADFHRECCALLHNIKPWLVTSKMRKAGKSLNFAIPYGMGVRSIAVSLFGVYNKHTEAEANVQLAQWQKSFHKIWDLLETKRDFAVSNGYVESLLGRRRYFYGEEGFDEWRTKLNGAVKASVRRASGNFPIQEGAADLFKIALNRFRARLKKEGLDHLVFTTATIHDELVNSVHKSVNPYFLYKIIYEECMLAIKGHPRYYAGISICDNWYEGKDDLYEAPIEFVEYMIKERPDISNQKFMTMEHHKDTVTHDIIEFMKTVFIKDFTKVGFDINNPVQDTRILLDNLQDYFLREKISVYFSPLPGRKVNKNYADDKFLASLERFIVESGPLDQYTILYPDDYGDVKEATITKDSYTLGSVASEQAITGDSILAVTDLFDSDNQTITDINNVDVIDFDLNIDDMDFMSDTQDFSNFNEETHDMSSIDALAMLEAEENFELFGDTSMYYYFETPAQTDDKEKFEDEDILVNPDKYIKLYDSFSNKVRVASDKIILNYTGVSTNVRERVKDYLDTCHVPEGTLGAISVVIKIGNNLENKHFYIKDYDVKTLQDIIENKISVPC